MIQDDIISLDANYYYLSILNASKRVMYSYHIYNGPSLMKEIYVYDPYSYDISGHIISHIVLVLPYFKYFS